MFGYIYMTTNKITGRKYIGQKKSSVFLGNKYLGSGKILGQAIKIYGEDSFGVEMIDIANSKEELNTKEQYYIAINNAVVSREFYNICKGGEAGPGGDKFRGHKHSKETREKMSLNRRGSKNANYGNRWTASEETRKLISDNTRGENNPSYGKKLINNGIVAKRVDPSELNKYLSDGWKLGSLPYRKHK